MALGYICYDWLIRQTTGSCGQDMGLRAQTSVCSSVCCPTLHLSCRPVALYSCAHIDKTHMNPRGLAASVLSHTHTHTSFHRHAFQQLRAHRAARAEGTRLPHTEREAFMLSPTLDSHDSHLAEPYFTGHGPRCNLQGNVKVKETCQRLPGEPRSAPALSS